MGGLLLVSLLIPLSTASYIESVAANVDSASSKKHEKFVPLVAFECGYRNKYLHESGVWVNDESRYATCQSGKLDILKYCKKAYPKLNVTNIVEYSHEVEVDKWCREEGTPCKWTHTVRPYHCIDGEFRSEALQVPHDCRFSHVNSRDSCNDYQHWRDESKKICSRKEFNGKPMAVRSFAVLEPCGLDLFTGVEFVCCPANTVKPETVEKAVSKMDKAAKKLTEEDDDDYEDDYTESDEDEEEDKKTELDQDPYFKKVDYDHEHENFKDALERLEKKHRSKIDVVMKEWSELEARYNKMKNRDPKGADHFKASMTNRFQKTVASLEEEHKKMRKDLEEVHEDRVQSSYNEKKRTATHLYRHALTEHLKQPNKANVLKTLKMYIRAEEKDRMHTLNKYRHLLRTDQEEARAYRETVLHKLRYIDLRINGTLAMMRDFPDLDSQVRPIAIAYWVDVRRDNTPELSDEAIDSLNSLDSEAKNKRLVDLYKESYEKLHPNTKLDVRAPDPTTTQKPTTTTAAKKADASADSEEDDDDYYEDEDDEEIRKVTKKPSIKVIDIKVKKAEIKKEEEETPKELPMPDKIEKSVQTDDDDSDSDSDEDDDKDEQIKELKVDIEPIIEEKPAYYRHERLVQHSSASDISRGATSQALFVFGVVFVMSACVMIVSMYRRRRLHRGFIEVDVCTPEERHVAGMQVNGYENPTYSFFDSKA